MVNLGEAEEELQSSVVEKEVEGAFDVNCIGNTEKLMCNRLKAVVEVVGSTSSVQEVAAVVEDTKNQAVVVVEVAHMGNAVGEAV